MITFKSLAEAMTYLAKELTAQGQRVVGVTEATSVGSDFGAADRPTKELIGFTFAITDPSATLIDRPSRPINVPFALANILWALSGSSRIEDIEVWNSRAAYFSDDGETIRSALGAQNFPHTLRSAIARLKADSSTRRAYIPLISNEDVLVETRDVPCAVGLHLMIRDSRLIAMVNMRSQSALMVLPYDVPLFTTIQLIAASELGIEPGLFIHSADSLHYYEDESHLALCIADGELQAASLPKLPNLVDMMRLRAFEAEIRRANVERLCMLADHLVAESSANTYATVLRACLLLYRLEKAGISNKTQPLVSLAGDLGVLTMKYLRGAAGGAN